MNIVRLDSSHSEIAKNLFVTRKHMGIDFVQSPFTDVGSNFAEMAYNGFCDTYLSGLNNYKAFGSIENGNLTSYFSFYESIETPDWYCTQVRSINKAHVPLVLDRVMSYNEENGRLKFFSIINLRYVNSYRRFAFSKTAQERYDYVDEMIIPEKTKCYYQTIWYLLFNRTLIPADSLIRCTFLRQKYRTVLPIAGAL